MSGTPTLAEIQAQWRAGINVLEKTRVHADEVVAGAGGLLDVLAQALEGEYTPTALAVFGEQVRAILSSSIDPQRALDVIYPCLLEWGKLSGMTFGGAYTDARMLMRAVYEYMHTNTLTVESRAITYDTSATAGGANVGNGAVSRLTVDWNGYSLESCHVETKVWRCRSDQNSNGSSREFEEQFEIIGLPLPKDHLLRASSLFGSGGSWSVFNKNAGSGNGGSLLQNSSFSDYNASATNKFTNWVASGAGAASITQHTANYYISHPGATTNASLRIDGTAGTTTVKQPISSWRQKQLDPETPYFYRVMMNRAIGSAAGGTYTIKLGSESATGNISALSATDWSEVLIGPSSANWFRQFNEDDLDVEITWTQSGSSGYLLVDDVILCAFDEIDGTYAVIRHNAATPASWLVDDTLTFTDTGGAPATAKLQWWNWRSGLGCLPSTTGSPTFTEPV